MQKSNAMKPFDEKFTDSAKDAFGSFNADHLVDAGWKAFVKKQSKTKGFLVAFPVWAKAASIAILLTAGGLFTYNLTQNNSEELKLTQEIDPQNIALPEDSISKAFVDEDSADVVSLKPELIASAQTEPSLSQSRRINLNKGELAESQESVKKVEIIDTTEVVSEAILAQNIYEIETDKTKNEEVNQEKLVEIETEPTNTLANQSQYQLLNHPIEVSKNRKTTFIAGLSGMIARVENLISDAPGVSVGLYAEHMLTHNISFRPGMAIAKHSYGLQTYRGSDLAYDAIAAPELNGAVGEVVSYENHMDIVAMEIPLNFMFKVRERRKSNVFITAGASSLVYLSQRFTGVLNTRYNKEIFDSSSGNSYTETNYSRIEIESEYDAFSRFDMFGLLNLSLGYSFPFTKNTTMALEPFIQIPVSNITSNNMHMGFGGVSLKVHLNR
jgi:hypothetical protein